MGEVADKAEQAGQDAHQSKWLDVSIRVGLIAYGVVHLMVAWLAAQLALGGSNENASNSGALNALAQQPLGGFLVWMVAVGMLLLVVWRLLEAGVGHRDAEEGAERWRKRAVSAGKAVIYGALGWSAFQVATGEKSKSNSQDSMTAKLMDLPAGQWIVGLVGLAIIGYGVNLMWRGWSEKFTEHLDVEGKTGKDGSAFILFGKVGYIAKGIAIGLVGGLMAYAAVTHEAKKSGGLDQALQTVLEQPFGQVMLLAIALGIACYGLFCFARSRHLSR